jgi:glutaredoxin
MILVEVFSKDDCHLCEAAKAELTRIRERHPFELRVTEIREGDPLFEEMKDRVPVIHIGGTYAFHFRVPEKQFIARLKSAEAKRP